MVASAKLGSVAGSGVRARPPGQLRWDPGRGLDAEVLAAVGRAGAEAGVSGEGVLEFSVASLDLGRGRGTILIFRHLLASEDVFPHDDIGNSPGDAQPNQPFQRRAGLVHEDCGKLSGGLLAMQQNYSNEKAALQFVSRKLFFFKKKKSVFAPSGAIFIKPS